MNEEKIEGFFHKISSNTAGTADLESCIEQCRSKRKSESPELSVIANSLLEVFVEIKEYLEYFNTEIARKFGFITGSSERKRVQGAVLKKLAQSIEKEDLAKRSVRLGIVDNFIKRWDGLPKEKESEIINSREK